MPHPNIQPYGAAQSLTPAHDNYRNTFQRAPQGTTGNQGQAYGSQTASRQQQPTSAQPSANTQTHYNPQLPVQRQAQVAAKTQTLGQSSDSQGVFNFSFVVAHFP